MSGFETVQVGLGTRGYDIRIGEGLLENAADHLADLLPRKITAIVTDETVAGLHLAPLIRHLEAAGIKATPIILAAGEGTKSFADLEFLVNRFLELKLERKDRIIALGGGVIGDLTGFAASITRRGMDFIQIPTTLLAQVDSSVGGKTGINTKFGKNLVGAFHQPKRVLADTGLLATLPGRELLAGYAEVVKYGLINDPDFFAWCEANGERLIAGDAGARIRAVRISCAAKAGVVARDETETGERALLNLGHTFGHALEAECGYDGTLLHGEGVAAGMALAFDLSVRMGICPAGDADRVRAHLKAVGLPSTIRDIKRAFDTGTLIGHMAQDKKVEGGKLTFILARGIGKAFIMKDVPLDLVAATLDASSR